jgi:O-antigen ligase
MQRQVPSHPPRIHRNFGDYAAPFSVLLLLYAGYFKANPILSRVPVDLTLLGAVLTLAGVVAVLLWNSVPRGTGAVLALWATFMPMAILHADNSYGSSKSLRLFTLTLLAVLGPLFLMRSRRRQEIWVIIQIALGAVLAIGTALSPVPAGLQDYIYQQAPQGSDPTGAGQAAGVAVVGCLAVALAGHRRRALLTVAGAALVVPMFLSGARGPVVAAAATLAVVAAIIPGSGTRRAVRVALIAIGMALTWFLVSGSTTGGTGRIASALLKTNNQDPSSQIRLTLWHYTLSFVAGHPWGVGWGGLQDTAGYVVLDAGLRYPHNVLLEVAGEAGWIAGAAVIVFLWTGLRRIRGAAVGPFPVALFGIAMFFTMNAMVSGDVNDNRPMWASVAIGWVIASRDSTPRTSRRLTVAPMAPALSAADGRAAIVAAVKAVAVQPYS